MRAAISSFESRDSVFEGKIGFESIHCMRDDENNYRDYRILLGRGNDPPYWGPRDCKASHMSSLHETKGFETRARDIRPPLKRA